jgi:hypothetical protein
MIEEDCQIQREPHCNWTVCSTIASDFTQKSEESKMKL